MPKISSLSFKHYCTVFVVCRMTSGGGSHPFHLPITTPPSHNTSRSQSNSLQTPDTSSLFVSSLGGRSGGGNGVGCTETNFSITSLDQAQPFTSLEELLDVTGINSMELGHSEMDMSRELVRDGHGVNSLQRLAREVEKNSGSQGTYIKSECWQTLLCKIICSVCSKFEEDLLADLQ